MTVTTETPATTGLEPDVYRVVLPGERFTAPQSRTDLYPTPAAAWAAAAEHARTDAQMLPETLAGMARRTRVGSLDDYSVVRYRETSPGIGSRDRWGRGLRISRGPEGRHLDTFVTFAARVIDEMLCDAEFEQGIFVALAIPATTGPRQPMRWVHGIAHRILGEDLTYIDGAMYDLRDVETVWVAA